MLDLFWRGDRFVARQSLTGEEIDCDSLLLFVPAAAGQAAAEAGNCDALVARLRRPGHFLTAHGLASESTSSQYYEPDGYWRGPLWGAPTVMLVEGLAAVGETELAADLRRRFCALVADRGLAENYDAITGAPLRDRAFTWTASAFLLLASELGQPRPGRTRCRSDDQGGRIRARRLPTRLQVQHANLGSARHGSRHAERLGKSRRPGPRPPACTRRRRAFCGCGRRTHGSPGRLAFSAQPERDVALPPVPVPGRGARGCHAAGLRRRRLDHHRRAGELAAAGARYPLLHRQPAPLSARRPPARARRRQPHRRLPLPL